MRDKYVNNAPKANVVINANATLTVNATDILGIKNLNRVFYSVGSKFIPYLPKTGITIANILTQYDFKVIFIPVNHLTLSKRKNPLEISNPWGIYSINCR